jgi:hypothetical protein
MVLAYTLAVGFFAVAVIWITLINAVPVLNVLATHVVGYLLFAVSLGSLASFVLLSLAFAFRTGVKSADQMKPLPAPGTVDIDKRSAEWRSFLRRLRWVVFISGVALGAVLSELTLRRYLPALAFLVLLIPASLLVITLVWRKPPENWRGSG